MQSLDVVSACVCSYKHCLVPTFGTTSFYLPELVFVGLFVCVCACYPTFYHDSLPVLQQSPLWRSSYLPVCLLGLVLMLTQDLALFINSRNNLQAGFQNAFTCPTLLFVSDGFCDCRYVNLFSPLYTTLTRFCPVHLYFSIMCQNVLHKWSLNKYLQKEVAVARNGRKLRWKPLQDISVVVWEKTVKDLISLLTTLGFIL